MNGEKQKILEMLENGTITSQEAMRLLEALDNDKPAINTSSAVSTDSSKKLRVKVSGTSDDEPLNVNVAVPLALARVADNIIANCIPNAAHDELSKQGINIRDLKIGELLDTLENLDEDIVNVEFENDEADLKVRVYVQ